MDRDQTDGILRLTFGDGQPPTAFLFKHVFRLKRTEFIQAGAREQAKPEKRIQRPTLQSSKKGADFVGGVWPPLLFLVPAFALHPQNLPLPRVHLNKPLLFLPTPPHRQ
nr:hypothetical protein [Azospirillum sp. TSA2s]